jgi:DNA polymerase IV
MRAKGRAGRTVVLRLRFGDFSRATSLTHAGARDGDHADGARHRTEPGGGVRDEIDRRGLTLVSVTVSKTSTRGTSGTQPELPFGGACRDALNAVLDEVRRRIGPSALTRATLLYRDAGLSHWLFPDEDPEL